MAAQRRALAVVTLATEQDWTDAARLAAIGQAVLAWGEQPEASCMTTGVTAVGWTDDHDQEGGA